MSTRMTPTEEHDFYSKPENQVPVGAAVRRRKRMGDPVPIRFPDEVLTRVRQQADADDRSVSSWIRRAVEHELERGSKK
jgi:Arc-like DNA binding domain